MTYSQLSSSYRKGICGLSLLIIVGGGALLAAAVWTIVTIRGFEKILESSTEIFLAVYVMIGIGALMMLISFLGCIGAMCESKVLLIAYGLLLLVIFLLQLVGSVLVFVFYPVAREEAQLSIRDFDNSSSIQEGWEDIQGVLECCGINNYTDWRQRIQYPRLPPTCCSDNDPVCSDISRTRWPTGCDKPVENYFFTLGSIGFVVLVAELIVLVTVSFAIRTMYFYPENPNRSVYRNKN